MTVEAFSDGLLGWIIRIAGLFWLVGAFMLYRQIRMEMMLDRMTSRIETMTREFEETGEPDEDGYGIVPSGTSIAIAGMSAYGAAIAATVAPSTPSSANWRWRGVIRSASCAPRRVADWRRAAAEGGRGDTISGLRGG